MSAWSSLQPVWPSFEGGAVGATDNGVGKSATLHSWVPWSSADKHSQYGGGRESVPSKSTYGGGVMMNGGLTTNADVVVDDVALSAGVESLCGSERLVAPANWRWRRFSDLNTHFAGQLAQYHCYERGLVAVASLTSDSSQAQTSRGCDAITVLVPGVRFFVPSCLLFLITVLNSQGRKIMLCKEKILKQAGMVFTPPAPPHYYYYYLFRS